MTQWVDSKRWVMQEKGLQSIWNELKQISNSIFGPTSGTATIGSVQIDATTEGATTIKGNGAGTFSGNLSTAAQTVTAGGMQTMRPDPGTQGGFGPTPTRKSQSVPQLDGFRA